MTPWDKNVLAQQENLDPFGLTSALVNYMATVQHHGQHLRLHPLFPLLLEICRYRLWKIVSNSVSYIVNTFF